MDAYEALVSDPWYAVVCEAHHALLGVLLALALLAGYFLISLVMERFSRDGKGITSFSWSAFWPLALAALGLGFISHYLGDYGFIDGWRW